MRHYWAHVHPKGKRVNYDDLANDESNCITLLDPNVDADEWWLGYEDPVGISVEPNQEDSFVTDMEDHGPDWDEDTIHIEVEDDLRLRNLEAQGVEVDEWGGIYPNPSCALNSNGDKIHAGGRGSWFVGRSQSQVIPNVYRNLKPRWLRVVPVR